MQNDDEKREEAQINKTDDEWDKKKCAKNNSTRNIRAMATIYFHFQAKEA